MNEGLRDLIAVLRCSRLALGLPGAVRFAWSGAQDVVRVFDLVIAPVIDRTIADQSNRRHVDAALRFASVKVSYLLSSYSMMAGLPFHLELSTLGGAFARLYDDLIDDVDGVRLDDRLTDLFHGRDFTPLTELESLTQELYQAIDERLDRSRDDPVYESLDALHEYQVLSRQQRDPAISGDLLDKVTSGKGGLANVALFALMRPRMSGFERELVMRLGEVLQLLDDYVDHDLDVRAGITTAVTRGNATLMDVGARLRALRPHLFEFYGGTGTRQFVGVLYALLLAGFVKRRKPGGKFRPGSENRRAAKWPWWILVTGGDGVVPRSNL